MDEGVDEIGEAEKALYLVILDGMQVEEIINLRRQVNMALLNLKSMSSQKVAFSDTINRLSALLAFFDQKEAAAKLANQRPSNAMPLFPCRA